MGRGGKKLVKGPLQILFFIQNLFKISWEKFAEYKIFWEKEIFINTKLKGFFFVFKQMSKILCNCKFFCESIYLLNIHTIECGDNDPCGSQCARWIPNQPSTITRIVQKVSTLDLYFKVNSWLQRGSTFSYMQDHVLTKTVMQFDGCGCLNDAVIFIKIPIT